MTDTEAEAPEAKKQGNPEQAAARRATRSVARALARMESKAGETEFKPHWEEKKDEYTAQARKLVRALTREGVTLTAAEGVGKKGGKGKKGEGKGGGKGRGKNAGAGSPDATETGASEIGTAGTGESTQS